MTDETLVAEETAKLVVQLGVGDDDQQTAREEGLKKFLTDYPDTRCVVVVNKGQRFECLFGSFTVVQAEDSYVEAIEQLVANPGAVLMSAGNTAILVQVMMRTVGAKRIGRFTPTLISTYPKDADDEAAGHIIIGDLGGSTLPKEGNEIRTMRWLAATTRIAAEEHFGRPITLSMINLGKEEDKGDETMQAVMEDLKVVHGPGVFRGNIEPDGIPEATVDAVVTYGTIGNVMIKTVSGMAKQVKLNVARMCKRYPALKYAFKLIAGLFMLLFMANLNWRRHNGALLLGFQVPVVKAHGKSDAAGFYNALVRASEPWVFSAWKRTLELVDSQQWLKDPVGGGADGDTPAETA